MSDNIFNNPKYHVFAILDQDEWILRIMVTTCNDPPKRVMRNRTVMPPECNGDDYKQIAKEMIKECIKELV